VRLGREARERAQDRERGGVVRASRLLDDPVEHLVEEAVLFTPRQPLVDRPQERTRPPFGIEGIVELEEFVPPRRRVRMIPSTGGRSSRRTWVRRGERGPFFPDPFFRFLLTGTCERSQGRPLGVKVPRASELLALHHETPRLHRLAIEPILRPGDEIVGERR
jgi:hypothetical protein